MAFFKFYGFSLMLVLIAACQNDHPAMVGTVEWDRVELVAETSEPIIAIHVKEGAALEKDQVILELDQRRQIAQLAQAKAAAAEAAARMAELERGPRKERINEAKARLAGVESSLKTAQFELSRNKSLIDKKLVSPQEMDRARSARDTAEANRDAARLALEELLAGTTAEELEQAKQVIIRTEAVVTALSINVERMTIRAPQSGKLDSLPFELGERPPVNAVVAVLLSGQLPYARVYVPEQQRVSIKLGSTAQAYVDGVAKAYLTKVRMVSRDPVFTPFYTLTERDRSRLVYLAKIDFLTQDAGELPAGLPLRVELSFEQDATALK